MHRRRLATLIALALVGTAAHAAPWTYRGSLTDGGQPANGTYDIRLTLLDANGKRAVVGPVTFADVKVDNGSFALDVDFGADLSNASAMKLKTEVGERGANFVALGEPSTFDAKATLAGVCWDTQGNAGTSAATDFIGTTDNQALNLRVNNARALVMDAAFNSASGSPNNTFEANKKGQTIAGGGLNTNTCDPNSNSPCSNRTSEDYATVSGGLANSTASYAGVIAGGFGNSTSGFYAVIGGGTTNSAGPTGVVGGGVLNSAVGATSTVSGGYSGKALGVYAVVPGGAENCAGGNYSLAAGSGAKVRSATGAPASCGVTSGDANGDEGTFVWADTSSGTPYASSGANQFLVRADGGMALNGQPSNPDIEMTVQTNSDAVDFANLHLRQRGTLDGILISAGGGNASNNAGFFIDHYDGTGQARRLALNSDGSVVIRSNILQTASGVSMAANGGSWTSLSDRNVKTAIEPVDAEAVLDKVIALPVSTWSYTAQGEGIRHIGPMAQDFKAAFEVGESDTGITTIDADGVALAAIQGLHQRFEDRLAAENATLRAQLEELRARMLALERAGR